MVIHGDAFYGTILHDADGIALYGTVLHDADGIALYGTVLHGKTVYCMVLHAIA